MTSITMRIPVDVVESMTAIPRSAVPDTRTLLKAYISDGMRHDEAEYAFGRTARLIEVVKRHGVPEDVLEAAARELA